MPEVLEDQKKSNLVTLNDMAVLFRRSYRWVKKHHISWERELGLRPILLNGNPRTRLYKRQDVETLIRKWMPQ
jgi:hypothetical protein